MTTVVLCEIAPHDGDASFEVKNVGDFLFNHFKVWPTTAKLYQNVFSAETEIQLKTEDDVYQLNKLNGTIYVVIQPQGFAAIGIGLLIATAAIVLWPKSKKSKGNSASENKRRNSQTGSPNNSLSDRSNSHRLNQRIPDIYGTVRSVPDVVAQPYKMYFNNQEVEYAYYCVGRGKYDISDVREGETLLSRIGGSSAIIYGPDTSPNAGTPQLTIGTTFSQPLLTARPVSTVNSQLLLAPNTTSLGTFIKVRYHSPNIIEWDNNQDITPYPSEEDVQVDFEDHFKIGDSLTLTASVGGVSGNFVIESVTSNFLTLENPGAINANWNSITTTAFGQASMFTTTLRHIGPFVVEDADSLLLNFIAENGLYQEEVKTVGAEEVTQQVPIGIVIRVFAQQVDALDVPFGSEEQQDITLYGSSASSSKIGVTMAFSSSFSGRMQVRAIRISDANLGHKGKRSDHVKWESLQSIKNVLNTHFGNVTTIYTRTIANAANVAGGRKLNCKASRLIPKRVAGVFVADQVTSRFADIFVAMAQDPRIGNRTLAELDIVGIYATQDEVEAEFGTAKCIEFNHTFDDDNLSFEESGSIVVEAAFCDLYRQGSLIKTFFERATDVSSILFNHRNKIPRTESRTCTFGMFNDKDGVEIEWFDSDDGTSMKIFIPEDESAINPEKLTLLGVTNKLQAYFHANRVWNRLQYQNVAVEFDATQEALLLNLNERILISDNTRANTFDGEVMEQDGLILTLSQKFQFVTGKSYVIFLQLADSSIESIAITPGVTEDRVVLAQATTLPLAVAYDLYARATYEIAESVSTRKTAFLVEEKNPKDHFVTTLKAINYDDGYYQNDEDFINGVVDANGNLI